MRYLGFQAAQRLLAVASRFCWKTHGLWHLIVQMRDIFQRKGLQTQMQLETECHHREEMQAENIQPKDLSSFQPKFWILRCLSKFSQNCFWYWWGFGLLRFSLPGFSFSQSITALKIPLQDTTKWVLKKELTSKKKFKKREVSLAMVVP